MAQMSQQQPQQNQFMQDFDVRFGQPYPKLGFKFSAIQKKWQVVEPYKISNSDPVNGQRVSNASSMKSGQSSLKSNATGSAQKQIITTQEDTAKLKLINDQKALIDKQIDLQATEKARLDAQSNLLKLQLIQVMEQIQARIQQVQGVDLDDSENIDISKLSLIGGSESGLHDVNKIEIDNKLMVDSNNSSGFDDSKIVEPVNVKKAANNDNHHSDLKSNDNSSHKSSINLDEEIQRI
eukprot:403333708